MSLFIEKENILATTVYFYLLDIIRCRVMYQIVKSKKSTEIMQIVHFDVVIKFSAVTYRVQYLFIVM